MNIMDFFNTAQSAASYITTIAEVILLIRLARLGLLWEFKIFSIFIAFDAALTVALAGWDYHLYSYESIWALTTPIWTLLLAGASLELMRGVVQAFPRETINRTVALYGFLIGMTVSAGASMWTHPQAIMRSPILLMVIGRRSILSGCILAILFQGAVLFIGDAPIVANWKLHRRILLALLTAYVVNLYATTAQHRYYGDWSNLLRGVTLFGCFCAWSLCLRRMFCDLWDFRGVPTDEQVAEIIVYNRRRQEALGRGARVRRASTM
jgi:hypothetical protein